MVNSAWPDLLVCARLELVDPAALAAGLGDRMIDVTVTSEDNTAIGKEADMKAIARVAATHDQL